MGKKLQGAALRAKKRQQAQLEELQEKQAEQVSQQAAADKTNEELFVLDTTGDTVPHHQRPAKQKKQKKGTVWSEREKKEMEKLLQKHSKEQLATMAQKGRKFFDKSNHLKTHGIRRAKAQTSDLWEEPSSAVAKKDERQTRKASSQANNNHDTVPSPQRDAKMVVSPGKKAVGGISTPLISLNKEEAEKKSVTPQSGTRKKRKKTAVDVAKSGQSYRPDPKEHQDVLREALEVETNRAKAEKEKNDPISPGMKPETKALLVGDSDTSDSEDEDSEDELVEITGHVFHKQKDKMTRAQRNKQKRIRREERDRQEAKKRKLAENSVYRINSFKKEINQEAESSKQRQEERQKREEEKEAVPLGKAVEKKLSEQDPIAAPTYPVALSSEVRRKDASLRTILPKGDLVTDRMASFALRNLAPRLPSQAAAHREKMARKRQRPKRKVKGAKQWVGDDFVIIK